MATRKVIVASASGLHARPAAIFAKAAAEQAVPVTIGRGDGAAVPAASILSLMTLGADKGDTVTLYAEGDRAEETLDTLVELLSQDLDSA